MINTQDSIKKSLIVLVSFSIVVFWAWQQPILSCPDERMRFEVLQFIFQNGSIPLADEPTLRDALYGFSYATSPPLPYLLGVLVMKIAALFTSNEASLLWATKFVSLFAGLGFFILSTKISEKLFTKSTAKWCFIIFCCFWPQVIFIFSYFNCDSVALFGTAVTLYGFLKGMESRWKVLDCIIIGIGVSICLLSYYNTAGFLFSMLLVFFALCFYNKESKKIVLKTTLFVFLIVFLLCGWFFVRNAILYHGDFLGMEITRTLGEKYGSAYYTPSARAERAYAIMTTLPGLYYWFIISAKSFVGLFGEMNILAYRWVYILYALFLGGAAVGSIKLLVRKIRQRNFLQAKTIVALGLLLAAVITFFLSMYYSFGDFQAQGRYLMPGFLFIAYFMAVGLSELALIAKEKHRYVVPIVFCCCFASLLACTFQIFTAY